MASTPKNLLVRDVENIRVLVILKVQVVLYPEI